MRKRAPEGQRFYQTYFQMPGVAEKEFDADPKGTLRMFLYRFGRDVVRIALTKLHSSHATGNQEVIGPSN
jgi:hypothetical protein